MPIYEYRCNDCGKKITIRQNFSETVLPRCPSCGSVKLSRLISQFSVARSGKDRINDLSWIDKDISRKLRKKTHGKLSQGFNDVLSKLESS